ncbi:MAG: hypothetical protein KUG78_11125 [Kangiellaceae bacterium]|nr:hypothetical protein [Kangiellaceae bacterium]
MSNDKYIDLGKERQLNQALGELADEEITARNLWPEIESRLNDSLTAVNNHKESVSSNVGHESQHSLSTTKNLETKLYKQRWIGWSIAASLIVSIGSVTLGLHQLEKAEAIYAHIELREELHARRDSDAINAVQVKSSGQSHYSNSSDEIAHVEYIRQLELMEREFKVAKAGLMARISMNQSRIDESLLKKIEVDLLGIETATRLLKNAIGNQPADANFTNLLRTTYQQELTVLTQLAKLDTTI